MVWFVPHCPLVDVLTLHSTILAGVNVQDVCTGYSLVRVSVLRALWSNCPLTHSLTHYIVFTTKNTEWGIRADSCWFISDPSPDACWSTGAGFSFSTWHCGMPGDDFLVDKFYSCEFKQSSNMADSLHRAVHSEQVDVPDPAKCVNDVHHVNAKPRSVLLI